MAQVAAVYTVQSHIRAAESIMKVAEDDNVVPFRTPLEISGFGRVLSERQKLLLRKHFRKHYKEIQNKRGNGLF
ncbi:hypothetical protein [sulfur-oxidizing endosymbiont of Gigantopelta aegis]|uniref:hypothetical protein n=1 Tax=sulfur-oxidizing endosymbiont of Gigantopelta aegis TaxID=2794934 RepID=UPI0018DD5D7B|nr:hypothetical protein [sulfur-oxidizing endosymbiont of Gigantopelta aegis]